MAKLCAEREGAEASLERCLTLLKHAYQWGYAPAADLFRERIIPSMPVIIRNGGDKSIKEYVSAMLEGGNAPWRQAKVMVLGRECVGKYVSAFCDARYVPFHRRAFRTQLYHSIRKLKYETNLSTDGIDVHKFSLLGLDLNWFDFGGQAIFYPTHQFFLVSRGSKFVAPVFTLVRRRNVYTWCFFGWTMLISLQLSSTGFG